MIILFTWLVRIHCALMFNLAWKRRIILFLLKQFFSVSLLRAFPYATQLNYDFDWIQIKISIWCCASKRNLVLRLKINSTLLFEGKILYFVIKDISGWLRRSARERRINAARFAKITTIDRFMSWQMFTSQRFCAGVRYDSHGSPAWRNNCTRSTRSSLVAVLDDRCRRDSLVAIIRIESCRRISRTPLPVRKSRPPSSNANQRYPDGLHRQKSDSQSHIWVLGRNNASLRLA